NQLAPFPFGHLTEYAIIVPIAGLSLCRIAGMPHDVNHRTIIPFLNSLVDHGLPVGNFIRLKLEIGTVQAGPNSRNIIQLLAVAIGVRVGLPVMHATDHMASLDAIQIVKRLKRGLCAALLESNSQNNGHAPK